MVAPSARPARRWRSHVLLRRANRVSLVRGRPYPSGTKRSWTPIRLASPFGDLAEAYNLRPQRIHQILRRWAPDAIRPQGHRRRRRRRVVAHGVAAPGCPGGSSPSKEARIIHAYATTDKPTTEIAEEFKVSKARVRAIVKQYAPKLLAQYKPFCRRNPLTKEHVTDLVRELSSARRRNGCCRSAASAQYLSRPPRITSASSQSPPPSPHPKFLLTAIPKLSLMARDLCRYAHVA